MPENRTEPFSSTGAMGAVKEKAQETTSLVKERAQEMASSVASKAEEIWDSTKQGVQQAASTVATTAEEAFDSVTHFYEEVPLRDARHRRLRRIPAGPAAGQLAFGPDARRPAVLTCEVS
jgi:hypothetical protein